MTDRRRTYWTGIGIGIVLGAALLQAVYTASGSDASSAQPDLKKLEKQAEAAGYRLVPSGPDGEGKTSPSVSPSPSGEAAKQQPSADAGSAGQSAKAPAGSASPAATPLPASPPAAALSSPAAGASQPHSASAPAASSPFPPSAALVPPASSSAGTPAVTELTVVPGMTGLAVVEAFVQAGLVSDRKAFEDLLIGRGLQTKIVAGTYSFSKGESAAAMIERITQQLKK